MKIGDLVRVKPSCVGLYVITCLEVCYGDTITKNSDVVALTPLHESGPELQMDKKWIKVISER